MSQPILAKPAYIYALSNPDNPGILLIGITMQHIDKALNDINQHSLTDYAIAYQSKTLAYAAARQAIDSRLEKYRVKKAFYRVKPESLKFVFKGL